MSAYGAAERRCCYTVLYSNTRYTNVTAAANIKKRSFVISYEYRCQMKFEGHE